MARYTAAKESSSGVPVIRLADSESAATALIAPTLGGNLFSLTVGEREVLRRPPDLATLRREPGRWGIPVLMPPSRIREGRFTFRGREYQLERSEGALHHIHGFPLHRFWRVDQIAEGDGASATLSFRSADHPDVMAQFPHPLVLTVTYTLRDRTLRCDSHISNEGTDGMPFGLGFHHYVATPEPGEGRYLARLTEAKPWEMEGGFPTERFLEPEGPLDLRTWQAIDAAQRDGGYLVTKPEPDGWSRFELRDNTDGWTVTMRAGPEFRHWVVFSGRAGFSGFICPEPLTCMTNSFNLGLPPEVTGMAVIEGGEGRPAGTWELTTDR